MPQLLIRLPKSAANALRRQGFAAGGGAFELAPLFEVHSAPPNLGLAPAEPLLWFAAQSAAAPDLESEWDLAHAALSQLGEPGLAAAPGVLVEPDLLQNWDLGTPGPAAALALATAPPCEFKDQRPEVPQGAGFAWHLADEFSGLRKARTNTPNHAAISIAHFDTGYDSKHDTFPTGFDKAAQRNFVEKDRPRDASDPNTGGALQNPGHGTATLAILAGNRVQVPSAGFDDFLGGAPQARVIPLRVANSVVQFRTSAVAQAFDYAREIGADVVTMSMGGLPSSAWTDAVNAAYEAGIVIVCAAGNNFASLPARSIVYPARFNRVIAACGVMANQKPYFGLPINIMQGNYGPDSKMSTAIGAYTPNMPWARIACGKLINMNGQGTSAATPQVAAAAALWLAKHAPEYPEKWMRVEAARKALFETAARDASGMPPEEVRQFFGNGLLRAHKAIAQKPAAAASLAKTPKDSASFPFLRLITGLGLARDQHAELFALEITQLALQSQAAEEAIPDPGAPPDQMTARQRQRFFEVLIESGKSSRALRAHLEQTYRPAASASRLASSAEPGAAERRLVLPRPASRRLRIFALDPTYSSRVDTAFINQATVKIPWEANDTHDNLVQPGPVGEYVEVVDVDPASDACYAPVDLNDPFLLAQDGLAPSEGDPRFHQQMVYAVSMLTIRNFEKALGRVALWSPRTKPWPPREDGTSGRAARQPWMEEYVPRLRIYPHALRQANAYYSPDKKALLFGYFAGTQANAMETGGLVFTCLSHDIVAHETTHALLDGLHRRYQEASNPDVLAFHEAFADIVAIFQHFTFPEILRHQIQAAGGDLTKGTMLAELARQFGEGLGRSQALRSAINVDPKLLNYNTTQEPHDRGSILVAAVFDAFLAIYQRRTADLLRLATGGTGILPAGALHPDLVNRLAQEAAKAASHVLAICIRALDYCPPVDITFGSYLRALITADWDFAPEDEHGYRIAFVEAFRRREIYPENVRTLSIDSLRWQEPAQQPANLEQALARVRFDWDLFKDRRQAFEGARANAAALHNWITTSGNVSRSTARQMGIDIDSKAKVEVHSVRPARRVAPDGSFVTDLVVVLTQQRSVPLSTKRPEMGTFRFRGGATILIDLRQKRIRYSITRSIGNEARLKRQREYELQRRNSSLRSLYFDNPEFDAEPFAMLHRGF